MSEKITFDQPPDKAFGPNVLIVDDEEIGRATLKLACRALTKEHGINLFFATSVPEAMEIMSKEHIQVLLLDKNLGPDETDPEQNGIESIPDFVKLQPCVQILIVSGSDRPADIVRAMRLGALGYVVKGGPEEVLEAQINSAISISELRLTAIRNERFSPHVERRLGGKSQIWRQLVSQAKAVAESSRPILFQGPTGSGKTTLAKVIHEERSRFLKDPSRPFCDVNIGSLSSTLVESELFGHEKGAFTDAREQKLGFCELANRGTLFLDEIGDASLDVQVRLLKVLDEGTFYRVGGKKQIHSRFKLICATHKDLEALVAAGKFREDLYMRISAFIIRVPGLSERKEDIPDLVQALLPKATEGDVFSVSFEEIPEDYLEYLKNNPPPGNIRGLENQLTQLLVLSPKDAQGRPVLTHWYKTLNSKSPRFVRGKARTLTLSDLLTAEYDVVTENFPGIKAVMDAVSDRIFMDAKNKFKTNNAVAKALRYAPGATSTRLRRLGLRSNATPVRSGLRLADAGEPLAIRKGET